MSSIGSNTTTSFFPSPAIAARGCDGFLRASSCFFRDGKQKSNDSDHSDKDDESSETISDVHDFNQNDMSEGRFERGSLKVVRKEQVRAVQET